MDLHLQVPLGLLGLPIGIGSIFSGITKSLATWVASGAGQLVAGVGSVLTATTEPPLGANFDAELSLVAHLGAALVPILLVLAAIEAIVRQDLSLLMRAMFLRAPVALLGSGLAVEAVVLWIGATDALSRSVVALAGSPASGFVAGLSASLVQPGVTMQASGFELVILAGILAVVALMLWIELAVRGAAIAIALLFVPLALAGVVFPATAHWARRLGETLFALVLSKFVIACVLSLAAASIGAPSGASGLVEGVALLLLAVLAPFAVLRLIPMAESGALGSLEGVGRRGLHLARSALSLSLSGAGASGGEEGAGPLQVPVLGFMAGQSFGGPEFEAEVDRISQGLLPPGGGENSDPGEGRSNEEDDDA